MISNLASPAINHAPNDYRFGQGVTAGSTVTVNSITVPMQQLQTFSAFSDSLLIRDASPNGTVLFKTNPITFPFTLSDGTLQNYTFTVPAGAQMNAGTTYYVCLADGAGTGFADSNATWAYNTSAGTGAPGWTLPSNFISNPSDGRIMLSIDATAIVPEPASAALLATAGLLATARRRTK